MNQRKYVRWNFCLTLFEIKEKDVEENLNLINIETIDKYVKEIRF